MPLAVLGHEFTNVKLHVDSAATCNTMRYHFFRTFGSDEDLRKSTVTLVAYPGESIRPGCKATSLCPSLHKFDTIDFEAVNLPGKPALIGLPDSTHLSLISFDKSCAFSGADTVKFDGEAYSMSDMSDQRPQMPLIKDYLFKNCKNTFQFLGCLAKPVSVTLDPKVSPVHAPVHRIPVAKRDTVNARFDQMEK